MGGIISLITGSIFSLIITRTLSPEEYGFWGLIFSVVSYFTMLIPIFAYWATRETARKSDSGKSSVLSSIGFSIIMSIIFISVSFLLTNQTGVNQNDFLFAAILIPVIFLNGILSSIALGYKPHVLSFSSISFGLVQIPSVLFFVYFFDMGISGIILSLLLAHISGIIILFINIHEKIKTGFDKKFLKKWLKLFWIPLYPSIYTILIESTILIFTVISGSIVGIAYWIASGVLASVVSPAGFISRAVYPKLLDGKEKDFLRDNLTYLFYFAILFTSLVITFARPGLFVLNPFYEKAVPIVIILAIEGFLTVLINVFQQSLIGIEKIDTIEHATYKDYIKSKLFYVSSLRLIQAVVYVLIFIILLIILVPAKISDIDLLTYWATIAMVTQIPLIMFLAILVKQNFTTPFDFKRISKYFITSIIVSLIVYFVSEQFLIYSNNLYQFLPNLLPFVIFLIGLYCIITYTIDSKIKILFNSIMCEIKNKI